MSAPGSSVLNVVKRGPARPVIPTELRVSLNELSEEARQAVGRWGEEAVYRPGGDAEFIRAHTLPLNHAWLSACKPGWAIICLFLCAGIHTHPPVGSTEMTKITAHMNLCQVLYIYFGETPKTNYCMLVHTLCLSR